MAWCITKSKRLDSSGDTAKNLGNTAGILVNVAGSCRVASTYCICLNVLFSQRLSSDNHNPKIPTTLPISSNLASKPAYIQNSKKRARRALHHVRVANDWRLHCGNALLWGSRYWFSLSHTNTADEGKDRTAQCNCIWWLVSLSIVDNYVDANQENEAAVISVEKRLSFVLR